MNRAVFPLAGLLLAGWMAFAPSVASAETLLQALGAAYRSNPILRGQQATQRATTENAEQARAGWRPSVSMTVGSGYQRGPISVDYAAGTIETNDAEAALTVQQTLYSGGRIGAGVRAADYRTRAGEQELRLAEATLFESVVRAYTDVLRDQEILSVRQADLATLARQVSQTNAEFELGSPVTRTDVAQAEAQREQAASALANAQAALQASRSRYRATVGTVPAALVQPEALPGLPGSLDRALILADLANPALARSRLAEQASRADIATARAAFNPNVAVQASVGYVGPVSPFHDHDYDREVTGLVTFTQPLLTGGLSESQVRQAMDRNEADRQAVKEAARQTVQDVETSWSAMRAGLVATHANEAQVQAASLALRGYQLEYALGLRSTLDVLIADENLRAAQVSLAESRHDTIVAEAALLAATGRLEARYVFP